MEVREAAQLLRLLEPGSFWVQGPGSRVLLGPRAFWVQGPFGSRVLLGPFGALLGPFGSRVQGPFGPFWALISPIFSYIFNLSDLVSKV